MGVQEKIFENELRRIEYEEVMEWKWKQYEVKEGEKRINQNKGCDKLKENKVRIKENKL